MKELSQKPDYGMMWKVECELNNKLQAKLKTAKDALELNSKISVNPKEGCISLELYKSKAREALRELGEV